MNIYSIVDYMTGLLESYFIFLLFGTFLKRRDSLNTIIYIAGIVVLTCIVDISNAFLPITLLNLSAITAAQFIISFLYTGKIKTRIAVIFLNLVISVTTEIFVLLMLSLIFSESVSVMISNNTYRLIGIIISKILCYAAIKYITLKYSKKRNVTESNYWILFAVMFCIISITMYTFCKMLQRNSDEYVRNIAVISSCGSCAGVIIVMYLYENMIKQQTLLRERESYEKNLTDELKHYKEIIITQNEIKAIKHDLNNHLISIKAQISTGQYDETIKYIDKLLDDLKVTTFINTGNTVLDAIITAKKNAAEANGIIFKYDLCIPEKLQILPEDECVIFGNALDNAIEACDKVKENKHIDLFLKYENNSLTCRISNSAIKCEPPFFLTSKKDKKQHGLGIENMDRSLSKYNSITKITHSEDEYTLHFILMNV